MNTRKQARADHSENRHGFGKSVDARAPVLAEEKQNGGNQCSGVADTDPEHEVHDRETPHHRVVVAEHADAGHEQIADHRAQ